MTLTEQYWLQCYTEFYNSLPAGREKDHLEKNGEEYLKEDPASFIQFLFVNHVLNQFDPIGCCYPMIWNEYSDYAWKIVESYRQNDPSSFAVFLDSYLDQIWSSLSQLDEIDRQQTTAKVKKEIVEKLLSIEM